MKAPITLLWVCVDPIPTGSRLWPSVTPAPAVPSHLLAQMLQGPTFQACPHQRSSADPQGCSKPPLCPRCGKEKQRGCSGGAGRTALSRGESLPARRSVLPELARPRGPNSGEGVPQPELSEWPSAEKAPVPPAPSAAPARAARQPSRNIV